MIARKVSQCSKNPQGANAFSAFTSIIRTLARHGDQALGRKTVPTSSHALQSTLFLFNPSQTQYR